MHKSILLLLPVAALWLTRPVLADEPAPNGGTRPSVQQQAQELRQQMEDGRKAFDAWMKEMQRKVDELSAEKAAGTPAPRPAREELEDAVKKLQAAPRSAADLNERVDELSEKVDRVAEAQKKTLLSEFNPAIGLVGETIFGYRSGSSRETGSDRPGGFDIFQRSLELTAAASIDPFAKGYVVINGSADPVTGEAALGVEEAALQTTSLPWNLELKAGRFFAEFGRLAYIHDHELPFVNRPLALDQYIGGESRTDGLQVNWLLPTPHYISLTAGVGDQFGGDSPNPTNPGDFRHGSGLSFWSRASTYFDLAPDWQLETGVSGMWNPAEKDRGGMIVQPNGVTTSTEKERRLAGLDVKFSWVPLRNNQFQSLTWGTELLFSDNRYLFDPDGMPNTGDESTRSVGSAGLYSYVTWKFHRQWSAGFLFDWVENPMDKHDQTTAYSPYITWALSHWNQLRLQYTHTDHNPASGLKGDDAIMLQWAWIIGSHSHGWQSR